MCRKKPWGLYLLTLIFSLFISLWMQTSHAVAEDGQIPFTDIRGSWAEKQINDWTAKGLIKGYSDGTFRPDDPITRAEFFALVNRVFGYTKTAPSKFTDVAAADWFAGDIRKAAAAGYIEAYPEGSIKPNELMSRQEAAVILSRIFIPDSGKQNVLNSFTDSSRIPELSRAAIGTAVENGYMKGYTDGSFRPAVPITRAETISVLDRAAGVLYNKAGTYGPAEGTVTIEGNATISTRDVVLKNTVVMGNLYLTEGIGDGNATLDNVVVKGTTRVKGGGVHSIVIINTSLGKLSINVPDGSSVRLVASENSSIGTVAASSSTILEESGVTGSGFVDVVISKGATVQLSGQFDSVRVEEPNTRVNITNGSIADVSISQNATGSTLTLGQGANVTTLTANAAAVVNGQGIIGTLNVNINGTSVTRTNVAVGRNSTFTIGGLTVVGNPAADTVSSGDSGNDDTSAPVAVAYTPADNSSSVEIGTSLTVTFNESIAAVAGKNIFIKKSSDNSTVTTIAANSAQVSVSGRVVTIDPANDLEYDTGYYILIEAGAFTDGAGNYYAGIDDASAWNFRAAPQAVTADLTDIALSGSPSNYSFVGSSYIYPNVTVTESVYDITVTPTGAGVITVDGTTVDSGTASDPISLTTGTSITITVVAAESGKASKTYSITVTRLAQPITADLESIALSGAPQNFSFAGGIYTYTGVTVANSVSGITVTPTGTGTITVNGTTVASGTASAPIELTVGTARTITIVATETGKSPKTYNITVTRQAAAPVTPTPAFTPAAGAVAFGTGLQITSAGAEHIYYTMDGSDPATTAGGPTLEYNDGGRPVISAAITVKAIATRSGYENSAIGSASYTQAATADLTGLVLSGSPANYTFTGSIYTYTGVIVANGVSGITVTPTGAGTITVEGAGVASGTASASISLTAGVARTITIVAKEEGKSPKTYTITVIRSDVADVQLTGLTENLAADFNPAFAGGTYAYTLAATGTEWTVNITPTLAGATVTWDVDTDFNLPKPVASGAAAAVPLLPGENNVTIHVEKAGTGSKDYVITITKAGDVRLASLTEDLADNFGPYGFSGDYYNTYYIRATHAESTVNITPTLAGATITWDINTDTNPATAVASGTAAAIPLEDGYNTITIHVEKTGANAKSYTIVVIRSPLIGEIAGGTGSYADGASISFGKTFSSPPVVLVNAYDSNGNPLIAGVRTEAGMAPSTTGFTLKLHDLSNNPVTSNATVQWVAINPAAFGPNMRVQAKYIPEIVDGYEINFDNSFSDSESPIVICSAYDSSSGYPIMAAPYNISKDRFSISLKEADGTPARASLWYIALDQPEYTGYYEEVSIISSYRTRLNGEHVQYNLFQDADAIICSAWGEISGYYCSYAAAARNNSSIGFDLSLRSYDGSVGSNVWTSWVAFGFK